MKLIDRRYALLTATGFAVVGFVPASRSAEGDVAGPFGLRWGSSSDDVRKGGVTLVEEEVKNFGVSYSPTGLTKVLTDMEGAMLSFGYNDQLWRVVAYGRTVGPDPSGAQVVARYRELVNSLADRYGKGRETDERDTTMWKTSSEYLMSIKQGRAFRYTEFSSPSVSVEIAVRALDGDRGYYSIIFRYIPGERKFKEGKKSKETDAL